MMIKTKDLLKDAQKKGYAVPAFNIYNLVTIQAVMETAEELRSPVILAATPGSLKFIGSDYLLALAKFTADKFSIPMTIHLDHFTDVELLKSCIKMGFRSVMIDASALPFSQNVAVVREVVEYGRNFGVSVEAELGCLPGREEGTRIQGQEVLTNPQEVPDFLNQTGVDSLAVAIGTVHGPYKAEPKLDYERLKAIREMTDVPLVLHGVSGLPSESVSLAIKLGICKINVATELKMAFSDTVKEYFAQNPAGSDPRKYLQAAKDAMKKVVAAKIQMCGSARRA